MDTKQRESKSCSFQSSGAKGHRTEQCSVSRDTEHPRREVLDLSFRRVGCYGEKSFDARKSWARRDMAGRNLEGQKKHLRATI